MNAKKRVACFFTGGYSELNAMKSFLKKANDKIDLIQLCPTGERRSKSQIMGRHTDNIQKNHSGLTGTALTDFVLDFIKKRRFLDEEYDAILIEDDKDARFLSPNSEGTASINHEEWNEYKKSVMDAIRATGIDIPIIIILAAPEVEAWFLSDWDNSFGKVYADIFTREQNEYFAVMFRKYINKHVLTTEYKDSIECYGFFDGGYKKLSEEIQKALVNNDFLEDYKPGEPHVNPSYSKRVQGETMLEAIDPNQVVQHCTVFLRSGLLELQVLA